MLQPWEAFAVQTSRKLKELNAKLEKRRTHRLPREGHPASRSPASSVDRERLFKNASKSEDRSFIHKNLRKTAIREGTRENRSISAMLFSGNNFM